LARQLFKQQWNSGLLLRPGFQQQQRFLLARQLFKQQWDCGL
jgi:hypothetical protein